MIGRLSVAPPRDAELFHLTIFLLHVPGATFSAHLMVCFVIHSTKLVLLKALSKTTTVGKTLLRKLLYSTNSFSPEISLSVYFFILISIIHANCGTDLLKISWLSTFTIVEKIFVLVLFWPRYWKRSGFSGRPYQISTFPMMIYIQIKSSMI